MKVYAIDFETTYGNECSVDKLGPDAYFRHEHFEAYIVTIVGPDKYEWVGHPSEAPWSEIADAIWISHNASFDETLYHTARDLGWWGDIPLPKEWHCTADMVAYLGYPRSLKAASADLLGIDISKDVRTNMRNLAPPKGWPVSNKGSVGQWKEMTPEFWKDVVDYATDDSILCRKLWVRYSDRWPKWERDLSVHTRTMMRRGIPVCPETVEEGKTHLQSLLFELEQLIPWRESDALLSRSAFDRYCRDHGITPPPSLANDDPAAIEFFKNHSPEELVEKHNYDFEKWVPEAIKQGKLPAIFAFRDWRRVNVLLKKVEAFSRAVRKCDDGVWRYFGGLKYCGAHTRRWSGGGGNLNLQNLPRGEMFGVNLRNFFVAPPGYKFCVADLSQIEVRTLVWAAQDHEMLEKIRTSPDIYEAFAIQFGLWDESRGTLAIEDPATRHLVKTIVLGCGYGASAYKFATIAGGSLRQSVLDRHEDLEKAAYRYLNDKLAQGAPWFWARADELLGVGDVEITFTRSNGTEVTKMSPAHKVYKEEVGKQLDVDDPVDPRAVVKLNKWPWDYEKVLIYAEAERCVNLYRTQLKSVPELWVNLRNDLQIAAREKRLKFELPSGNALTYRSLAYREAEAGRAPVITCLIARNGRWTRIRPWHGLLTENVGQSLARDVFADRILALEEAGYPLLLHVHDEALTLVKEDGTEEASLRGVEEILSTPPTWIPSLPLAAEAMLVDRYTK